MRKVVLSFRVNPLIRKAAEQLAAKLTIRRGIRVTLSSLVEECIQDKAKKERIRS